MCAIVDTRIVRRRDPLSRAPGHDRAMPWAGSAGWINASREAQITARRRIPHLSPRHSSGARNSSDTAERDAGTRNVRDSTRLDSAPATLDANWPAVMVLRDVTLVRLISRCYAAKDVPRGDEISLTTNFIDIATSLPNGAEKMKLIESCTIRSVSFRRERCVALERIQRRRFSPRDSAAPTNRNSPMYYFQRDKNSSAYWDINKVAVAEMGPLDICF